MEEKKMVNLLNLLFEVIVLLLIVSALMVTASIIFLSIDMLSHEGGVLATILNPANSSILNYPAMLVFLAATGICFNGIQEASPREKLWDYERFGQRLILYASVFSAIFFIISVYIIFSVFSSDAATHPGLEASIVLFVRNTSVMLKPLMPVVLIIICYNLTGPLCRHDVNITLRLFLIFSALWLIVSIMETVVFAHQLKAVPVFMFIMNISIGGLTIITSGLLVFYTKLYMKYNGGKIKKGEPYNPYL